ncbi:MAG: sigma-70 family RNA polymerase sigma factor [Planctomycetota bacterium]|nr:sigma-70 family RNA polymerase sigma factor [Planctomycetota bacterium]
MTPLPSEGVTMGGQARKISGSTFGHPGMRLLCDQLVRFSPSYRKVEQAERAGQLLAQIEPDKRYPWQFICFRITLYRPDSYPHMLIEGQDLIQDLPRLIKALNHAVLHGIDSPETAASHPQVPVQKNNEWWTTEEICTLLGVCSKTIQRWKRLGFAGDTITLNGKRRLVYRPLDVEAFVQNHPKEVERGSRFMQTTDAERERILLRVRQMVTGEGLSITDTSRCLAKELGRSVETVRALIKRHDHLNPATALFPKRNKSMSPKELALALEMYRKGTSMNDIALHFERTRTMMRRLLFTARAQYLLSQDLDSISNPDFDKPDMEGAILGRMPLLDEFLAKQSQMKVPKDVPPELTPLYTVPLLNKDQEQHLFRKMNYLKYHANKTRLKFCVKQDPEDANAPLVLDPAKVKGQLVEEVENLLSEAVRVKELLISANMRLVVNVAKRHSAHTENFFELLSDGNISLIRAVEKFDYSRGFKFSTYASWALMKNFARSIPTDKIRKDRYVTGQEDIFELSTDYRTDEHEALARRRDDAETIRQLLRHLDPRERQIISMRAGLEEDSTSFTLEQIGDKFGITKERVRQLHARSMKKLRCLVQTNHLDLV